MSRKINQNPNIKGIPMGDEILHLLSQFADDTALYLQYDKLTIESVIATLMYIEAHTGLNYDKTLMYRIGSLAHSDAKLYTSMDK